MFGPKLLYFLQVSLEWMDELFGANDMSNVEDIGMAAKQAKKLDFEEVEGVKMSSKV